MAVDPEGDGDGRVAEAFVDDPGVDTPLEGQGRPGVAEAVEGQAREPVTADSTEEGGADRVGPEPGAVGLVEDEAEVVEVGADEQALFEHAAAVVPQGGDGGPVEGH